MQIKAFQFEGVAPRVPARLLPETQSQLSNNVDALSQTLRPLKGLGPADLADLPAETKSLYLWGGTIGEWVWFAWDKDVDVARGQIAADKYEWTVFTGDGRPKITNANLRTTGTGYEPGSIRLGLPAPSGPLEASIAETGPQLVFGEEVWSKFTTAYGLKVSWDTGETWTDVALTDVGSAEAIHAALVGALPPEDVIAGQMGDVLYLFMHDTLDREIELQLRYGLGDDDILTASYSRGRVETRIYTWTWIREVDGLVMESGPAAPAQPVDVCSGNQVAKLRFPGSGALMTAPDEPDVTVTGVRIYRSAGGTYLFVAELPLDAFDWNDYYGPYIYDILGADYIDEQMPKSQEPPAELQGVVNLANGVMAGFVGQDVYFCDPYRPYSWPDEYRLTVDYPIVGLGALDTTLVVLTEGTPYLIQGAHPDSMVMVRSGIEQSCLSKRSIVSLNGAVLYAAPDGLISLSPSANQNLTQAQFSGTDWNRWFAPETIHAYAHNLRYYAFCEPSALSLTYPGGGEMQSTEVAGFIFDVARGVMTTHSLPCSAGHSDLLEDELFLLDGAAIRSWGSGDALTLLWHSKRFAIPHAGWFSFGQVEAYGYPVTLRVFVDGALAYSLAVTSREAFRLPGVVGRDWELEIEASDEVYNVVLAQSAIELHGA